jgi:hypothetical protein
VSRKIWQPCAEHSAVKKQLSCQSAEIIAFRVFPKFLIYLFSRKRFPRKFRSSSLFLIPSNL